MGSFLYVKEEGEIYMENSGVSFLHVITLIFVVLKLTGVINWTWWLVLLPSLINFGLILGMILFVGVFALVTFSKDKDSKSNK